MSTNPAVVQTLRDAIDLSAARPDMMSSGMENFLTALQLVALNRIASALNPPSPDGSDDTDTLVKELAATRVAFNRLWDAANSAHQSYGSSENVFARDALLDLLTELPKL